MSSLLRMGAITGKEIRQLSRDRLTFGMIVGIPLLQILLFGYAINLDVRHLRAGVADQATTQLSRQLIAAVEASQVVDIVARARTAGLAAPTNPAISGRPAWVQSTLPSAALSATSSLAMVVTKTRPR